MAAEGDNSWPIPRGALESEGVGPVCFLVLLFSFFPRVTLSGWQTVSLAVVHLPEPFGFEIVHYILVKNKVEKYASRYFRFAIRRNLSQFLALPIDGLT